MMMVAVAVSSAVALLAAGKWDAQLQQQAEDGDRSWQKAPAYPPPPSLEAMPLAPPARQLRVHLWTIPAHGHYMTLRDVGVALASRGHAVTFVMCDRNRRVFEGDDLGARGMDMLSAGECASYDGYDAVMAALINSTNLETLGAMLDGVATLAQDMCTAVMPVYERARLDGTLPDVIVFDADTFCAMDVAVRYAVPYVPRVGTGLRDVYTSPLYVPQFGTALPLRMTTLQRLINAASIVVSRLFISPHILPRLQAARRDVWRHATVIPASSTSDVVVEVDAAGGVKQQRALPPTTLPTALDAPRHAADTEPDAFRVDIPWDGATTLFNSHWGLEYARPLAPYEHLIGHTTDFVREGGATLPPALAAWLAAAPDVPVVYVGMGTLSIIGRATLDALATAMATNTQFRFVWSVPVAQQELLPPRLRSSSDTWLADPATAPRPVAGDALLLPWVPQLATLLHNVVRVPTQITHARPCVYTQTHTRISPPPHRRRRCFGRMAA